MTNIPNNLKGKCPLPYDGAKSGYIRHDVDCNKVADADDGVLVKQNISGIEYRNFNKKYQKSNLKDGGVHPEHVEISNGWNSKFIKQVWWDGSSYQNKVGGLSQKYVEQTLYQKWIIDESDPGNLIDGVNQILVSPPYEEYIHRDVCNSEVSALFTIDGPTTTITPLGDIFLALEGDRDNTIINEERTLAILLEDNTTLYQIDYENDYFVREEGDLSLSYESGGLIEPS